MLMDMYRSGKKIDYIASCTSLTNMNVIKELRSYKVKTGGGRGYSQTFKSMVVDRLSSGVARGLIASELGIAYRTINKFAEEFEYSPAESQTELEKFAYTEIAWKDYSTCPCCLSKNINDLRLENDNVPQSYCKDCGTEWFESKNITYKVNWEYLEE